MPNLTPREAAAVIGCTPQNVRTLIRSGTLRARKVPTIINQYGYRWSITRREAERVRDLRPNDNPGRGRPRGVTR